MAALTQKGVEYQIYVSFKRRGFGKYSQYHFLMKLMFTSETRQYNDKRSSGNLEKKPLCNQSPFDNLPPILEKMVDF